MISDTQKGGRSYYFYSGINVATIKHIEAKFVLQQKKTGTLSIPTAVTKSYISVSEFSRAI